MKKGKAIFYAFILAIIFASNTLASDQYYPDKFVMKEQALGVSMLHPDEIEKAGIDMVVAGLILISPQLFVETVAGNGVWQIVGINNREILRGSAYLSVLPNPWGDFLGRTEFLFSRQRIGETKFILLTKDGTVCFSLVGERIGEYNPKKFNDNEKYQFEFLGKHGLSLDEMEVFWKKYSSDRRIPIPEDISFTKEIKVFSSEWNDYKTRLTKAMSTYFDQGEKRLSFLDEDIYKDVSSEITTFDSHKRVLKNVYIPLSPFVLLAAGASFPLIGGAIIAGNVVSSIIDDRWAGHYWNATAKRGDLALEHEIMSKRYKEVIAANTERYEKEISKLKEENENLRSANVEKGERK
jgi:hypothetical protein